MPPEVLSEIFGWTLPLGKDSLKRRKFRITDSPWVFTHVSCRWRAVAVRNPLLWSLVAITYSDTDPSTAYPLPMVETQISRAHTFKIHFHGYESSDSRPQFQILQCLAKHASRWEELSLTVTSGLSPLLINLRGRLPLLRRLWIQWDNQGSQAATDSIQCFESAPSLVDVGVYSEYRAIPVSFPAQQLTRYELDAPWDIHRGILKLTQNLVEACVTISFDSNDWSQPELIELLCLRRLYISAPLALTFLKFPLLDEIALYLHPNHDGRGLAHLESSVARSLCPIRKLCIQGCSNAPRIAEVLQTFHSIVDLAIITDTPAATANAGVLLDILDEQPLGSRVVAPQLCRLSFGCTEQGSLDHERFCEVVKYRWEQSVCSLKYAALFVNSGAGPDAAVLSGLNALREEGLDFFFVDGSDASVAMDGRRCYSTWNQISCSSGFVP
ncbi:hypothetical protein DFH06DRAFT_1311422 [Mycena polygramma]|nr:hypothetical protein DFH06DRAFT_1311422 [Mycena polygramma]